VLAVGGVATAAALTDKTGLSTVAPAAVVPTPTTSAAPGTGSAAPVAHAPAAVQPADSPAHPASHSPVHEHPTTTAAPTTTSKASSSGGEGYVRSGDGGADGG
jgi:hypothetical protein